MQIDNIVKRKTTLRNYYAIVNDAILSYFNKSWYSTRVDYLVAKSYTTIIMKIITYCKNVL